MRRRKNAAARLRRNKRKAARRQAAQVPATAPRVERKVAKTRFDMPDGSGSYLQDDIPTICPVCNPTVAETELVSEQFCPSHMPSVAGTMDGMSRLNAAYVTATMEAGDGGSNRVVCDSVHRGVEAPRPIETPVVQ